MKISVLTLSAIAFASLLKSQPVSYAPPPYGPSQDVGQLVAPIALYPDPLVAVILPAATMPADIVTAERYLESGQNPDDLDSQPWEPSVRSLAHYPELIKWLSDNIQWTQALGQAFLQDPNGVMQTVQQLRAQARASGVLTDTPQQRVVLVGGTIVIEPVQPGIVYVPQYDPGILYGPPPAYRGSFLSFGVGLRAGAWLNYQLDWDDRAVWVGPWHRDWDYHRDWRDRSGPGAQGRTWRADAARAQEQRRELPRMAPDRAPSQGREIQPARRSENAQVQWRAPSRPEFQRDTHGQQPVRPDARANPPGQRTPAPDKRPAAAPPKRSQPQATRPPEAPPQGRDDRNNQGRDDKKKDRPDDGGSR